MAHLACRHGTRLLAPSGINLTRARLYTWKGWESKFGMAGYFLDPSQRKRRGNVLYSQVLEMPLVSVYLRGLFHPELCFPWGRVCSLVGSVEGFLKPLQLPEPTAHQGALSFPESCSQTAVKMFNRLITKRFNCIFSIAISCCCRKPLLSEEWCAFQVGLILNPKP